MSSHVLSHICRQTEASVLAISMYSCVLETIKARETRLAKDAGSSLPNV